MISEMTILAMLLCVGIAVMGLRMKIWPVTFVSSLGWVVIGLRLFDQDQDFLVLALVVMAAISQIIMSIEAEQ